MSDACCLLIYLFCHSPHPYIFFNKDERTLTFVGFTVKLCEEQGNLINPVDGQILEEAIMTKELYTNLVCNDVDLQDDCRKWSKADMIKKLATVMGVKYIDDPDKSYVLTVDNLIKILAIQIRFR